MHIDKVVEPVSRSKNLINAKDCFVLIIDVQSFFMQGMNTNQQEIFVKKCVHLIELASLLDIPIIVTAEDIQQNGTVHDKIYNKLSNYIHIYDKFIYSCWGQENIRLGIEKTKRKTAIICGLETDVCVAQTSLDLLAHEFRVVILADITYSRNITEHKMGLKRMEYHGAILSLLKTWQEEITAGIRTEINFEIKKQGLNDI